MVKTKTFFSRNNPLGMTPTTLEWFFYSILEILYQFREFYPLGDPLTLRALPDPKNQYIFNFKNFLTITWLILDFRRWHWMEPRPKTLPQGVTSWEWPLKLIYIKFTSNFMIFLSNLVCFDTLYQLSVFYLRGESLGYSWAIKPILY